MPLNDLERGAEGAHRWALTLAAPALERLAPLWRLLPLPAAESELAGSIKGNAALTGRWPALASQGALDADGVRLGQTRVRRVQARWQLDMTRATAAASRVTGLSVLRIDPCPAVPLAVRFIQAMPFSAAWRR